MFGVLVYRCISVLAGSRIIDNMTVAGCVGSGGGTTRTMSVEPVLYEVPGALVSTYAAGC